MSRRLRAPALQRLRYRGLRALYALEPGPREMPTYFIVGGKRCGTTSLDEYVVAHPHVIRGLVVKGSRYYDVNYSRGERWFRKRLPPRRVVDALERSLGVRPIFGESSPFYSVHPEAPRRIAADVPDARLLFCLRDPVDRAWSHHRYEVARGFENLGFMDALRAEDARLSSGSEQQRAFALRHFSYATRGRYAEQLTRLRSHFPPENLLVLDSEQLFATPVEVMQTVFDHLGLPAHVERRYDAHKSLEDAPVPDEARSWLVQRLADDVARLDGLLDVEPVWRSRF